MAATAKRKDISRRRLLQLMGLGVASPVAQKLFPSGNPNPTTPKSSTEKPESVLPGTTPLTQQGDLAKQMVDGFAVTELGDELRLDTER